MINYVNEELFRTDSVHKDWRIVGTGIDVSNSDLYGDCVDLFESICKDRNIIFGSCIADTFKFTTFDVSTAFKNKAVTVSTVLDHDEQNPFSVGNFIVDEETLSADRTQKEVNTYHSIYSQINHNVASWYNSLNFPLTGKQFRNSFFSYCGIIQESANLVNDSMTVRKTIDTNDLSGLKVLNAICEANGVLGHMSRTGTFKYIQLGTSPVYDITPSMYENCYNEDYVVQPISKLQVRQEDGDIGVIIGSGNNSYVIEDNFLFYGMGTDELEPIAQNIFDVISVVTYTPCQIDCIYGNLCVEVGDRIRVTKKDGTTFLTYVLSRTVKGLQYLSDRIEAKGDAVYPDDVNGIDYDIRQLRGKSNVLARSIEETRSTITNVAAGLHSEIVQTAEGLEIEIESLQSQIDGAVEYYETTTTPTLTNYPAWDFTSAFKCDGTKKCAPLYRADMTLAEEGETGQYPHFYYSEQDYQDHLRDLVFDTVNAVSYRFNRQTDGDTTTWFWQEVADGEMGYVLQQISELKVTAEELSSDMTSIEATVGSQGLQIQTNTSNITQTASAITSEVSRATTAEGNLSSRITQNATDISAKVSAERTNSSFGWYLKSDKFELKSNNNVVFRCNSAGIYINGNGTFTGTIESTNARITGGSVDIAASSSSSIVLRAKYGNDQTYMTPTSLVQKSGSYRSILTNYGLDVYASSGSTSISGGFITASASVTADSINTNTIYARSTYGNLTINPNVVIQGNFTTPTGKDVKLAGRIGFFGHTPVSRSTVTGSTDSAKLSSLLTVLRGYGLIG